MALSLQSKPSQAKPNKTYYQMDKFSFAKGGINRLQAPFLVKIPEKAFFVLNIFPVRFVVLRASTGLVAKNCVARSAGGLSPAIWLITKDRCYIVCIVRMDADHKGSALRYWFFKCRDGVYRSTELTTKSPAISLCGYVSTAYYITFSKKM